MKGSQFLIALCVLCIVMTGAIYVMGGDLNPGNTPSPTMRTLDEVYKNIQPGLPSDWAAFAKEQQVVGNSSIHLQLSTLQSGDIHGSCQIREKEDTIISVGLGHQLNVPYDEATGQITSLRRHSPMIITKYIDESSPLLYKALCNNETAEAYLKYYRTKTNGQEEHYYTIHLQNCKIVSIKTAFPNIEQISLLYQTITWIWEEGGIEYTDSVPGSGV